MGCLLKNSPNFVQKRHGILGFYSALPVATRYDKYVCMYVCMYACMYVCMLVCVCVCLCVCVYMYVGLF